MADDLQEQLQKRRTWFFETQLRRLNMDTFINLNAETTDAAEKTLLNLISESAQIPGVPAQSAPRVYLDNQQPVWTGDEHWRRGQFAAGFIGRRCDWLNFKEPARILENLAALREASEKDPLASVSIPGDPSLPPEILPRRKAAMTDGNGQAIARAMIAEAKPWLLPELYDPDNFLSNQRVPGYELEPWLQKIEQLIADFETELNINIGGSSTERPPFDAGNPAAYRAWIRAAMQRELQQEPTGESTDGQRRAFFGTATVRFLDEIHQRFTNPRVVHAKAPGVVRPPSKTTGTVESPYYKYEFNIRVQTNGFPLNLASEYTPSHKVKYWVHAINDPLREVYVNKPDSDMGLVSLIRTLYLFGTIPETVASGDALRWRKPAKFPEEEFNEFFERRRRDKRFYDNPEFFARLANIETKLRIILETKAENPGAASITFSPIVGRVLREGLHHYKYWLDEPMRAVHNANLQKARSDLGYGNDAKSEMEYWSENHYLMFASSEYLAGQLWEHDAFQPGKAFGQTDGILSGRQRKERGKARVLKWLNNRLMFGWTEFNASGYLREHLWALLNLVDFAMDTDVREKATVVTDLLLFDAARFQHKGAMGAAGGRSQFKSKASGWDNGLDDAVEILFGTRGMFCDGDSLIGAAMATTTYKVPDVLLEIGTNPPQTAIVDRSRVSITFDEAYKYGIWFSQESDEATSRRVGYDPKLQRHYRFIKEVNDAIDLAHNHNGYTAYDDSIVFWWTTSAFVNAQVVDRTLDMVEAFGLEESGIWAQLPSLLNKIRAAKALGLGGFLYGGVEGVVKAIGGLGPIGGLLEFFTTDKEDLAEELAVVLDGSTRTRANIITYSNGDVMLSSIQNFRAGQLNYQSDVSRVTLNRTLNVFTTAGYAGIDMAPLTVALAGGIPLGPIGSVIALIAEGDIEGTNQLGNNEDGPGWWTGYLSLPMVVQHRGAAIIAYQYPDIQGTIAETQSHVWFPKNGFARTDEMRSSAYEDDNSIFPSKNGHWLFGKITHPVKGVAAADWPEAYVGVFSNEQPEWLYSDEDHDADLYVPTIKNARAKPPDNAPKEVKDRWSEIFPDPLPRDYFADKDWNVEGKNIWIIQVGSKAEFGDYDQFKARVSSAKVIIDDVGDVECTYHMPTPGGGSQTLTLEYDSDDDPASGVFKLDGAALQTDLYPRFDSPYIRGAQTFPASNSVEWGQRAYIIEHNGKTLVHDYLDFDFAHPDTKPVRNETIPDVDPDIVRALVIFVRTGDEEMEESTIGTATVKISCNTVATEEIIAVGPVGEDNNHDAEWIFFEESAQLSPDLTIDLAHQAFGDGDDDAEWDVSYSVKALMGDYRLRDCTLSFAAVQFTEDNRRTGPVPLSVRTDRWRRWEHIPDSTMTGPVVLAKRPPWRYLYYDHCDLLVAGDLLLWHRRVPACRNASAAWFRIPSQPAGPEVNPAAAVQAFSRSPGHVVAFAVYASRLFTASAEHRVQWSPWTTGTDLTADFPPNPVPFASPGGLYAAPSAVSDVGAELVATGGDGHVYANFDWQPGRTEVWRRLEVTGFVLQQSGDCIVANDVLFVLGADGSLWSAAIDRTPLFGGDPVWIKLSPLDVAIRNVAAVDESAPTRLLATATDGQVWDVTLPAGEPPRWVLLGRPGDQPIQPGVHVAHATVEAGRLDIFVVANAIAYTATWTSSGWGGWKPVVDGEQGFRAANRTPLVVHRVNRQIELLVEREEDGDLMRTWWS